MVRLGFADLAGLAKQRPGKAWLGFADADGSAGQGAAGRGRERPDFADMPAASVVMQITAGAVSCFTTMSAAPGTILQPGQFFVP